MLAALADAGRRGRIFGFHQAMDNIGAVIGPLAATLFLYFLPGRYRLLFALTAIPGALAVAMLFLVREDDAPAETAPPEQARRRGSASVRLSRRRHCPADFTRFMSCSRSSALGNSADAFLLLRLTDVLGARDVRAAAVGGAPRREGSLSTWGGQLVRSRRPQAGDRCRLAGLRGRLRRVRATSSSADRAPRVVPRLWLLLRLHGGHREGARRRLAPAGRQGTRFGIYNAVARRRRAHRERVIRLLYDHVRRAPPRSAWAPRSPRLAAVALLFVPSAIHRQFHMPRILVTNDDGVTSEGIRRWPSLRRSARSRSSRRSEASAIGHALTLRVRCARDISRATSSPSTARRPTA